MTNREKVDYNELVRQLKQEEEPIVFTKPNLKPCPFCGGMPISSYIPPHEHYLVDMPPYEGSGCVECPDCECAVVAKTEEEAIEKWNRRNGGAGNGNQFDPD